MAERERHSTHFDAQALGEVLGTRAATVRDVAYGEGHLFSAGHGTTRLEVFPRAEVTRLTAQDLRVELFGTADAAVSPTGVEFHRSQPDQEASLTVLPGGGVVFTLMAGAERTPPAAAPPEQVAGRPEPAPPPGQSPQTAPKPAPEPASPLGQPSPVEAPSAPLTAPAGAAATESPTTRPTPATTEPTPQSATEPAPDTTDPPVPPPTREAPASPPAIRAEPSPTPPRTASPAAGDTQSEPRQPGPEPRQTRPEQAPRVQLSGRLGRDPTFRTTTKTGTLVGRFPLAEHADDGTTRWYTVLAFGDRAHQLQRRTQAGELAQGREVDVVGYLHTNTRPGKDGRPRPVQEVYATAVTRH